MKLFGKHKNISLPDDRTLSEKFRNVLLGDEISEFIVYLKSPWRIIWANFLGGIFRGLGIIIGMTLVIGIIIWLLSQFVNFPLIGNYFKGLLETLEQFSLSNGYR